MCTLMTVSRTVFDLNETEMLDRIEADWQFNSDGSSLLLLDDDGVVVMNLRTFDAQLIAFILRTTEWARLFLHHRMATQGDIDETNIHGWAYRGVYVMHNGILQDPAAAKMPVDSMLIGRWVIEGGLDLALDRLGYEQFANVLLIAPRDGIYCVARSSYGNLHTDGDGSYSTTSVGPICMPAISGSHVHLLAGGIQLSSAI